MSRSSTRSRGRKAPAEDPAPGRVRLERMQIADLEPAPYNPRQISEEALAGLGTSVDRFGLVEPVVWNRRTGHVVGGHQRLKVLQARGVTETDVVVVDLPEGEEKALNVALNSPRIAGGMDAGCRRRRGRGRIAAAGLGRSTPVHGPAHGPGEALPRRPREPERGRGAGASRGSGHEARRPDRARQPPSALRRLGQRRRPGPPARRRADPPREHRPSVQREGRAALEQRDRCGPSRRSQHPRSATTRRSISRGTRGSRRRRRARCARRTAR